MASPNEGGPSARHPVASVWRSGDPKPVEAFLQLLARAVRQFHTYPATSPLCVEAIAACHKALAGEGVELFALRVTPHDLLVGDTAIGAGTIIEHELTRRLHHARVAAVDVSRRASLRDLSRFCDDLMRASDAVEAGVSLADLLDEHGVQALVPRMAERAVVLDVGVPEDARCQLVARERQRREFESPVGQNIFLYPPGRGWVRMDPAASLGDVSLVDLAVLVDDPQEIAGMLLRLADEEPAGGDLESALEKKFSEVASLFSSLDPRLARLMFHKLARAVLDLEPDRRQALLKRTILPGLFEGTVDAQVLRDFPDPDLAESLCLLLDLETAAPTVLSAALDRLDISPERREAVAPLLEARVQARADAQAAAGREADASVDKYARKLLRIDLTGGRRFEDFSAFDLSIDAQTSAILGRIRDDAATEDPLAAQLDCLAHLVALEPNPDAASGFLARARPLLTQLEEQSRLQELASWFVRARRTAEALAQRRPDVAEVVAAAIADFCTRERAARAIAMYEAGGDQRAVATQLFEGYGPAIASASVALLDDPAAHAIHRTVVNVLCEHAQRVAPELATHAARVGDVAARAIVTVFGHAGAGYEAPIAEQFRRHDEQTIREGLRALSRIGTPQAASFVAAQLEHPNPRVRVAAEESLWRFSPPRVQAQLRELLAKRDFVVRHPVVAGRLLDRAGQMGTEGMERTLAALASLRYRFWSPALARVGSKARKLVNR